MIPNLETPSTLSIVPMAKGYDGARKAGKEDIVGRDLIEKIEKAGVYEVSLRSLTVENGEGVGIDDRSVDRLMESSKRRGGWLHYPIVQKSSMKVIAGKRRILADKKAQKDKTFVRIVDVDDKEAKLIRLEENAYRFKPDMKETYQTFASLQRDFQMTQAEIAEASGFSQNYISKILAWGNGGFKGSPSRIFPGNNSMSSSGRESGERGSAVEGGLPGKPSTMPNVPAAANPPEDESGGGSGAIAQSSGIQASRSVPDGDRGDILPRASDTPDSPSEGIIPTSQGVVPPTAPVLLSSEEDTGMVATPSQKVLSKPSLVPVFFPIDDNTALAIYRGFINGYVQSAIKKRNDPLVREHLEMLVESIMKALR